MEPFLVGRDGLLADLVGAIHDGGVLLVTGDPGIGKTRLVGEALRKLDTPSVLRLASAPSASLPLGPFMEFVERPAALTGAALTSLAARVRRGIRGTNPRAIVVDDVHDLDPASADLLGMLAADGIPLVLVTSAPHRAPEGIRRLVRTADRLRVPPLDDADAAALVEGMLPGRVHPALTAAAVSRAGGVPLVAVELVRYLVDAGLATRTSGMWQGPERMPRIPALAAMVDERLVTAALEVREAVETIALTGGLPVDVAERLAGERVLEAAEDAGWLEAGSRGGGDVVEMRHRLLAEAVSAAVPELRRRRLLIAAADALPADGDVVAMRRTQLRLEAGAEAPLDDLLALAEAVQVADPELARRATDRASAVATSTGDLLRIASLHLHQQRLAETMAALARLEAEAMRGPEQLEAALAGVFLVLMVQLRPREALTRLDDLAERYGPLDVIRAHRSTALWLMGRPTAAAAEGSAVMTDAAASPPARAHAAQTVASASIATGDDRAFAAALDTIEALRDEVAAVLPETAEGAMLLRALHASDVALDPTATVLIAQPRHDAASHRGDEAHRAQYAAEIAWALLLAGRATEAVDLLRAALPAQGMWTALTRPWVAARLVVAARAAGASVDVPALLGLVTTDYFVEAVLARACAVDDPRETLAEAERRFAATGGHHAAAMIRYAAVREGDVAAARRFLDAPGHGRPAAVRAMTRHASAIIDGDGIALEATARDLDDVGLRWFAATCQRQAVEIHLAEGSRARAGLAMARLRRMSDGCPGEVRIPAASVGLTPRELEVTELVAHGLSDRQVADRLALSVRTVNAHLGNVYRKTGVCGRRDLALLVPLGPPDT